MTALVQKLHLGCNVSCPSSPPNHVPLYCHDNSFKRQAWKCYLHVNILQRFQTITDIRINQKSLTWPKRLFHDLFTKCLFNFSASPLFSNILPLKPCTLYWIICSLSNAACCSKALWFCFPFWRVLLATSFVLQNSEHRLLSLNSYWTGIHSSYPGLGVALQCVAFLYYISMIFSMYLPSTLLDIVS